MRKYRRGLPIKSVSEFDMGVADKNGVVYGGLRNDRPINYAFLQNMQYRIVKSLIKNGVLYRAIRIKK